MAAEVYVAPGVAAVRAAWDRSGAHARLDLKERLDAYAEALCSGGPEAREAANVLVQGWAQHPRLLDEPISHDAARQIVAFDHGFASWSDVVGSVDPKFELAVDAVTLGELSALDSVLKQEPALTIARSAHGHHATLLHYVAANGVEIRRQVVPANAPAVALLLLERGADAHATMAVYGGNYDTLGLMRTSAHPFAAGVAARLDSVLSAA